MIVYDIKLLENKVLVDEAKSLQKAGFISKEQCQEIESKLPEPKRQKNIFFRIALFVLGIVLYASICGFASLIGLEVIQHEFNFFLYLFAAIGVAGTEFFAKQNVKGQGQDDTFNFGSQLLLAIAVGVSSDGDGLQIAIVATIMSLLMYMRYLKTISALIFVVASTAVVAYTMFLLGSIGQTVLPFTTLFFGIAMYFVCKKIILSGRFPYYQKGLLWAKNAYLVVIYAACNYYVVRELSEVLLENEIPIDGDIPLAWFFYLFTVSVPAIFIFSGIKQSNRPLLWIGFATAGFAIFTIRTYHHVLPPELALTSGGLALFGVAYLSIKKLKDKTTGITFQPDRFINTSDFMHTEALLLTSQFGLKPEITPEVSPMEYGGGDYSGGGSGGSF